MHSSSYSSRRPVVMAPYLGPSGLTGLGSSKPQNGYSQGPGYSSSRYRDYSNSRYSEVTSYSTPNNYHSRTLRRGNSLEPTPSSPAQPVPSYSSSSLSRAGSSSRALPPSSSDLLTDYLAASNRHVFTRDQSPASSSLRSSAHNGSSHNGSSHNGSSHLSYSSHPSRGPVKRQQSVDLPPRIDRDPRDHTRYFTPREKLESFRREPYREKQRPVSCDKVYNGIMIGNGETIQNISHLKGMGVTHVLNTAEQHVEVSPGTYSLNKIQYYGFHVDDLPHANISRYFRRTTDFIQRAVESGGTVVVNCYMGLSRSATCVIAYLMMKQNMTCRQALEVISQGRKVRPNPGFLQQLSELEHTLRLSGRFAGNR